jgi:hypothetical protein
LASAGEASATPVSAVASDDPDKARGLKKSSRRKLTPVDFDTLDVARNMLRRVQDGSQSCVNDMRGIIAENLDSAPWIAKIDIVARALKAPSSVRSSVDQTILHDLVRFVEQYTSNNGTKDTPAANCTAKENFPDAFESPWPSVPEALVFIGLTKELRDMQNRLQQVTEAIQLLDEYVDTVRSRRPKRSTPAANSVRQYESRASATSSAASARKGVGPDGKALGGDAQTPAGRASSEAASAKDACARPPASPIAAAQSAALRNAVANGSAFHAINQVLGASRRDGSSAFPGNSASYKVACDPVAQPRPVAARPQPCNSNGQKPAYPSTQRPNAAELIRAKRRREFEEMSASDLRKKARYSGVSTQTLEQCVEKDDLVEALLDVMPI